VRDFGIRGVDLAYELLEGYDGVVLVDAAPVGEQPGDLAVIEPTAGEEDGESEAAAEWDSHSMNPVNVLRMARRLGATWGRMLLVGCQPTPIAAEDDIAPGLSEAVARAVELAAELVAALVAELVAANELRAAPAELTKHN
jgi:hydrogenase maturation protease